MLLLSALYLRTPEYGSSLAAAYASPGASTNDPESSRLWLVDIFSFMCCLPQWRAMTLPLPVTLKRLAAACR